MQKSSFDLLWIQLVNIQRLRSHDIWVKVFLVSLGVDADAAEWPSNPGDWHHRQGDGEEIWQILQEDDLAVSTEGPREKVLIVMPLYKVSYNI